MRSNMEGDPGSRPSHSFLILSLIFRTKAFHLWTSMLSCEACPLECRSLNLLYYCYVRIL
jgi:hypothetical protein